MKKITVAGAGYVGIANAVLLAQHNDVTIYDISNDKIALLQKRVSPIKDKEIEEYLQHDLTLSAVADKRAAYAGADFVVVATPTDYDSEKFFFDTKSVEAVIHDVEQLAPRSVVVIKSTVPVGFTQRMCAAHPALKIIFSPEFLREGKALYDNLYPSRIIVGGVSSEATQFGALLLEGAAKKETPVLYMQPTEAEAVKLFANTFLALRVAYFNELDTYTELYDLDSKAVIQGVCLDPRIGDHYNNPSFGYGGYCLPKDTKQLKANYQNVPNNLINAIVDSNKTRKEHIAAMILRHKPNIAGVYKLAMKAGSDNSRSTAVLDIIEHLQAKQIEVIIFDPAIKAPKIYNCPVVSDFATFAEKADIIIANRMDAELVPVQGKVYTRDVFMRD